jgi:uncharacterized protein (DUF2236 family)
MHAPLLADDAELLRYAGIDEDLPPEAGLFRPDGWLRRISGEPSVLFGGARALLLEVAHPLVAAGVSEHSDFRRDPFGRLQRTLAAMTALAFAPRDAALAAVRGVARSHETIHGQLDRSIGPFAAGADYHGRDPDLVLWVWATLVDTALAVYRDFVGSLDAPALAEYHRDQRCMALLLGAPPARTPGDPDSFRRWFDGVVESDTLTVGETAREIAASVLATPGADRGPVPLVTAALLPARLREAFGLAWDASREAAYRRLVASVRGLRSVDATAQGG